MGVKKHDDEFVALHFYARNKFLAAYAHILDIFERHAGWGDYICKITTLMSQTLREVTDAARTRSVCALRCAYAARNEHQTLHKCAYAASFVFKRTKINTKLFFFLPRPLPDEHSDQ